MSMKNSLLPCLVALAGFLAGCGGGGSANSTSGGSGTMNVRIADAPDPTITSIDITFSRLEAHVDNDWVQIPLTNETVDLMDLTDEDLLLGSATLPAGKYTQIRLFPESCTVTDSTGTHNVTIPSATQTGIKVNINADLDAGGIQTLLLDFNVDKSLIKQGNGQYRLQPVLVGVIQRMSGVIKGVTTDGTNPLVNAKVKAVYKAGTFYPIGTVVNESASVAADANQPAGSFTIWAVLPGTYELQFDWLSADGTVHRTATKTGVVVTADTVTDVGSVTLNTVP